MRQHLLLLLMLISWGTRAQTLLQQQSFEGTGTDALPANAYTATTIVTSSTSVYFSRSTLPVPGYSVASNSAIFNPSGSYIWASESVRRDAANTVRGNPPADLTLMAVNVAGKTNLSVTVALADASGPAAQNGTGGNVTPRWETNDFVRVQYRFDGAGPWNTIGQFVGDDPGVGGGSGRLRQDKSPLDGISNVNIEPTSPILTQTLTDYNFLIPGSGTTLEVRVEVDDDGFSEEFGFDNIRVYGTAATSSPPQLAALETAPLAYAEGQAATPITGALTVNDSDSPTLSSATVRISLNNNPAEDRLAFVGDATTGNIAAAPYDATNGVLTLTSAGSTATLAQWQNALRKVTYQNIDVIDASPLTRTVAFAATDPAGVSSNSPTRTITVSTALDAATGLPYLETLETDGEGTRYASNHFFTQDAAQFQRNTANPTTTTGATFTGIAPGTYYWLGVNTGGGIGLNPTGTGNGTFTTRQVNAAGYINLHFQIQLGASTSIGNGNKSQWKPTDYFQLFYRTAGSSTWTAFGLFRGTGTAANNPNGTPMLQDSDPNGTGVPTGTALKSALQNFDFPLPSALNGKTMDFRLVLVNSDGANVFAYDQLQVTGTQAAAPTVTTATPTSIAGTSAVLGGNVTADGGAAVTTVGVVYSSSNTTPAIGGSGVTQAPNGSATNPFSQTISGLTPGITYYVRAYATNSVNTSYGATINFTTPNAPTLSLTLSATTLCANGPLSLTATAMNTGSPVTYSLSSSPAGFVSSGTSPQITLTAPSVGSTTAFTLTVAATSNAGTASATTVVTVNPPPAASVVASGTLTCSQPSVSLTAQGGTTYRFSGPGLLSQSANTALVNGAGVYSVTVVSGNGCSSVASTTVSSNTALSATAGASATTALVGSVISLTATGGTTYQWSSSAGATLSSPTTNSVVSATLTSPGIQTFTVLVTQGACSQTVSLSVSASYQTIDLMPTILVDNLNFSSAQVGVTRDFIVNINEVSNRPSSGAIAFKIAKLTAFTITYSLTSGTSTVNGGIANSNSNWSFSEDANYITVQANAGFTAFSNQIVGFHIARNPGVPINTIQSINITILPNAGSEQNFANNVAVTSVTAN